MSDPKNLETANRFNIPSNCFTLESRAAYRGADGVKALSQRATPLFIGNDILFCAALTKNKRNVSLK
jgi:hypothetical protein